MQVVILSHGKWPDSKITIQKAKKSVLNRNNNNNNLLKQLSLHHIVIIIILIMITIPTI